MEEASSCGELQGILLVAYRSLGKYSLPSSLFLLVHRGERERKMLFFILHFRSASFLIVISSLSHSLTLLLSLSLISPSLLTRTQGGGQLVFRFPPVSRKQISQETYGRIREMVILTFTFNHIFFLSLSLFTLSLSQVHSNSLSFLIYTKYQTSNPRCEALALHTFFLYFIIPFEKYFHSSHFPHKGRGQLSPQKAHARFKALLHRKCYLSTLLHLDRPSLGIYSSCVFGRGTPTHTKPTTITPLSFILLLYSVYLSSLHSSLCLPLSS